MSTFLPWFLNMRVLLENHKPLQNFKNIAPAFFLKTLRNSLVFSLKTYFSITFTSTGGFIFVHEHESLQWEGQDI